MSLTDFNGSTSTKKFPRDATMAVDDFPAALEIGMGHRDAFCVESFETQQQLKNCKKHLDGPCLFREPEGDRASW